MSWVTYLQRITDGARQVEIAKRTGLNQANLSRWMRGETVPTDAAVVAHFAECYGANVLEALIAAGMLTPEQAGAAPDLTVDFYTVVDDDEALSERAKAYLRETYSLMRAMSALERSTRH